jgi:hypothetical protein
LAALSLLPFVAISLVFATEAAICVLKNENEQVLLKIEESLKNISLKC